MTNALTYPQSFAKATHVNAQTVALQYLMDHSLWPWLSLPPWHPVLLEKYQYFGATVAGLANGLFDTQAHTALTRFRWQCDQDIARDHYATQGECFNYNDDSGMGFKLDLSDQHGQVICHSSGEGFLFSDRDYVQWREKTRQQALADKPDLQIEPIAPALCGLPPTGRSFVAAGTQATELFAQVNRHDGFYPQHPFHTGSGDHVNAAQLLDCALQAAHVFSGAGKNWAQPMYCFAGDCNFKRYLELDIPFVIRRDAAPKAGHISLKFHQAGRLNCSIQLQLKPA